MPIHSQRMIQYDTRLNSYPPATCLKGLSTVDAYKMVIAVADNPLGKRIPADPLTEPTIRSIFFDFFRS
jgi:hypothetical protein